MMVTGAKKWYLGVLVFGRQFMWFEIERDEDEIAALAKSEETFWELVKNKTAPVIDGTNSTTESINTIYSDADSESVSLFGLDTDLELYISLTAQIKSLETLKDECANKVKHALENASRGDSNRFRVSWNQSSRQTFDSKAFAADHPDVDLSKYYKTSKYRTFKVSELKEN
jgi:predicted phage-related endonuclease